MQQITILYDIVRLDRASISRQLAIGIFLLFCIVFDFGDARGPHHPKSEINRRAKQQQHINEHLAVETKYVFLIQLHQSNIQFIFGFNQITDTFRKIYIRRTFQHRKVSTK